MLAIVFSELDFHREKDCLLKTLFSFSGICTETFWISLGMVRNSLLITEKESVKSWLFCLPPDMFKVEIQLWKLDAFDLCCTF